MESPYLHVTVDQFEKACNQQGVSFGYELRIATMHIGYKHARELAPQIADILMYQGAKLASGVIADPVFPQDNVCTALHSMINASVAPPQPGEDAVSFAQSSFRDVQRCDDAEGLFAMTFSELKHFRPGSAITHGGRIYLDQHGSAAILQKSTEYSSGVALKDGLYIGGIPIPRGALLHLMAGDDDFPGYDVLPKDQFTTRSLSDITKIAFVRLSAFASEPEQREVDLATEDTIGTNAFSLLSKIAVAELQPLVQNAVSVMSSAKGV